ncbi:MAG: sigma-70 family RNA polymerase sigma factor [Gemmatimonadota bacterium]|nr:sigma-70 family RNA polymerase sigma factor [Gemmatimonadota bacterium]
MHPQPPRELVRQSLGGNPEAFVAVVRHFEDRLATLIRYFIDDEDDAADVFQDTVLQAWVTQHQLRDPSRFGPWLFQIARNRSRDFLRRKHRRELPTSQNELERILNQSRTTTLEQAESVRRIMRAIEKIPDFEADAIKDFYFRGLKISEIATRTGRPDGTIKRRLSTGRNRIRDVLGVSPKRRRPTMPETDSQELMHRFPQDRPTIQINRSERTPFYVDCQELRWWFAVPRVDESVLVATYSPDQWTLTSVMRMEATGIAEVHGVEGIEIEVTESDTQTSLISRVCTIVGRLTEERAQYLAVFQRNGKFSVETFLSEAFWRDSMRKLEPQWTFDEAAPRIFARTDESSDESGAGNHEVRIDGRLFSCLRVLELEGIPEEPDSIFTESFVTSEGRTLLRRHYCHPECENVSVDHSVEVEVDGAKFVHWYDNLTDTALRHP